jgi:PadR family transcriptional regulator, regulatory protein PadR
VHPRRGFRTRTRNRRRGDDGAWRVRARVERFAEPALLLLLSERPTHGYELLERLPTLLAEERVDVGNLYRILRALEEDGVVSSEWSADLPGPAKRTYTLTADGHALLEAWRVALSGLDDELQRFTARTKGGEHVRT